MICTHNNFGTSYINPMVHEMLNDNFKKKNVFSLPKIKRGQSLSRNNLRGSGGKFKRNGESLKRVKQKVKGDKRFSSGKDFMYPYSLFEKIMKIKAQ